MTSQTVLVQCLATEVQKLVTNLRDILAENHRKGANGTRQCWDQGSKIKAQVEIKVTMVSLPTSLTHMTLLSILVCLDSTDLLQVLHVPGASSKLRSKCPSIPGSLLSQPALHALTASHDILERKTLWSDVLMKFKAMIFYFLSIHSS